MAEQDKSQERTEQPTPKRLREAKEKGQVPRSKELGTAAVLLASAITFMFYGQVMISGLTEVMRDGFSLERALFFDTNYLAVALAENFERAFLLLIPIVLVLIVVTLLAPLSIGGWSLSADAMSWKGERINPLSGLKRIFSARGLMELVKALAKFALISTVAVSWIYIKSPEFLSLGIASLEVSLAHAASLIAWSFLIVSASVILIAAVDVPFQLWEHTRQLKMTFQEVKDELKETEGSPEVKSKIRQLQREIAQRRMMEEVPKADVIVTNPTHYSVALKYEQQGSGAPIVIAKGLDLIALRIRTIADAHQVPVVEAPPLARALYHSAEIGDEVPEALYVAVAQVLAYVYQLNDFMRQGGGQRPVLPEVSVPQDYTY